jgi:uncharacterized protein
MGDETIKAPIDITQHWIQSFVVDLNLCPFAKREVTRNAIDFRVYEGGDQEGILHALRDAIVTLDDNLSIETSFLILPSALPNFRDFNDFQDVIQRLLELMNRVGIYQMVGFHPRYQFAGTAVDDAENYTNRSPYPMLHILRESSVDRAVETSADAVLICDQNVTTLNQLGAIELEARWRACFG